MIVVVLNISRTFAVIKIGSVCEPSKIIANSFMVRQFVGRFVNFMSWIFFKISLFKKSRNLDVEYVD